MIGSLSDVRAVQDNIVRKVVTTLGLIVNADQLDVPCWRTPLTDIIQEQGLLPHLDRTFKTRLWPVQIESRGSGAPVLSCRDTKGRGVPISA